MRQRLVLVLALAAALALGMRCGDTAVGIAFDPYASVAWASDVRCKTQFHDHIDVSENRLQAYDDAGYCAVSFLHYSGMPGLTSAWRELHWPPQQWFDPVFLASLRSIRQLIPDAEHGGYIHFSSPFLTTYLECYYDAASRYDSSVCARAPTPKQAYHYSSEAQLVDRIQQLDGLANLAHPTWSSGFTVLDDLPVDMMEICSANAEYQDWKCKSGEPCGGWADGPIHMIQNYDRKLASRPRTWGLCVNDWHGPFDDSGSGPAWIPDSGYQIVLAPKIDLATLKQRVRAGAMLAVRDRGLPKGQVPRVTRITVGDDAIVIEAEGYERIDWIQAGSVVVSGPFVSLADLAPGALRAEIHGFDGSVVFTQPWGLR